MIVKSKKTNIHYYNTVRIVPGNNTLNTEEAQLIRACSGVKEHEDLGLITVIDDNNVIDEEKTYEDLATLLSPMTVKDAKVYISEVYNVEQLEEALENESRKSVIKALKNQIESLKIEEEDDDSEESYDDSELDLDIEE